MFHIPKYKYPGAWDSADEVVLPRHSCPRVTSLGEPAAGTDRLTQWLCVVGQLSHLCSGLGTELMWKRKKPLMRFSDVTSEKCDAWHNGNKPISSNSGGEYILMLASFFLSSIFFNFYANSTLEKHVIGLPKKI